MNQQDYLRLLKTELEKHGITNVSEILLDYQEHFAHALGGGKTEEEIVSKLGQPDQIAKAYETEAFINKTRSQSTGIQWGLVVNSIGRLFIIAPFNFFFLFIPAIIIGVLLLCGWAVSAGIGAAGLGILGALPGIVTSAGTAWAAATTVFMGLGVLGFAAMGLMMMYIFTKYIALAVINYLQWNVKFVLAK